MATRPLVSICIPTYNGAEFILQALESVVAQTYPHFEIVISDDASHDKTLQIVKTFQETEDLDIRIFHHTPSGIGANWNNCIRHARGDYIKFLFQDDLLFPTCIEELINPFLLNKKVGLTACKREIIIGGQRSIEQKKWLNRYSDLQTGYEVQEKGFYLFTSKNLKQYKFVKNNRIGEPTTVLFKKAFLKEIGLFNEELIQVVDFEFYYRFLKNYNIIVLNKELAAFRIHADQATNKNRNKIAKDYQNYSRILYSEFFWHLDYRTQIKLLKQFHPLGKLYRYIRY